MPGKVVKGALFDDFSDSGGDDEDDELQQRAPLRVNEEYARRFEHNSRRAELHRLQERHPELAARLQARELEADNDDDTESSSSEEEDEGELSPETEQEWAQVLLKIKRKDPSIYNAETRLFHESSASKESQSEDEAQDGDDTAAPERKKSKKKVLREILYDQAVAEGGDEEDAVDTDWERKKRLRSDDGATNATLAYDQEQRALREAFVAKGLGSDADDSNDGEGSSDDEHGGLHVRKRAKKASGGAGVQALGTAEKDLNAYFASEDKNEDAGTAFLKQFLQQRLWAQDGDDAGDSAGVFLGVGNNDDDGAPADVDDEDIDFLDHADRFEKAYNFRSEEENGGQIATFPRRIEGLARQEDSKRKRQREAKRVREQERAEQRKQEVKRLKNLKKREVGDALSQLAEVSGKGAPDRSLLQKLLDSDFDPAAWDQHMSAAFDAEYYAEAEREDDVTAAAPDVMKEVNAWVAGDEGDAGEEGTFAKVHKKVTGKDAGGLLPETDYAQPQAALGSIADEGMADDDNDQGDGSDESGDDAEEPDGTQIGDDDALDDEEGAYEEEKAASRSKVHDLLRDYYKLDHEDEVGGVKTRFRYRAVAPIRDGLSTEEILSLPDRDLNSIIGLRKLAPYREDVSVVRLLVRPNYKALEEARQKLVDEGLFIDKSKSKFKRGKVQKGKVGVTESSGVQKRSASTAQAGRTDKRTARKSSKKKQTASAGDAEHTGKAAGKKRPGPALRRAMKEAAAAKKAAGDDSVMDSGAHKSTENAVSNGKPAQGQPKNTEYDGAGSKKGSTGRKTLHVMTDDEKAKARAASYAGVALPSATVKHSSTKQHKNYGHRAHPKAEISNKIADKGVLSDLPKAARKNLKRKQKRESAWAGREAQA